MDLHLIQRDHPDPRVGAHGIPHRDPYFQACWAPLLHPWTGHVVSRVAQLTASEDRNLTLDELSRELSPEPADFTTRANTVVGAMVEAEKAGLGSTTWHEPHRATFCVYRHVPLLAEPELRRLTDAELHAHVDALRDVNRRLVAAQRPPLVVPAWLDQRLGRSTAIAVEHKTPAAMSAQERLDRLTRPAMGETGLAQPGATASSPSVAPAARLEAARYRQAPSTPDLGL